MVKQAKIYRNNKYILIPLEEFLEQYHSKIKNGWHQVQGYVNEAFNIKTQENYNAFLKEFPEFDYNRMHEMYERIKIDLSFFDDDILKFIAFITALGYFEKIGNPSLDVWINADNFNKPFEQCEKDEGYSLLDILPLKYGTNAIRNDLLSAWKIVTY